MEKPIQTGAIGASLGQIAELLGGDLLGPADFFVARLASADSADPAGLAFAERQSYVMQAKNSGVGALLVGPGLETEGIPAVRVPNPRLAFFSLLTKSDKPYSINPGIHPTAVIGLGAVIEDGAQVGPYAVVEPGAIVRSGAQVHAHAFIGDCCELKNGSVILPHVVLLRNVEIGARSVVFPGSVLGADGFGFVWDGSRHLKVPQVGRVVIGEDCEIGALSAVDRATAGTTSLGAGTKIDNLVQIGHNCKIGDHVVIAAASALGGSAMIGDRSILGGGTGVTDHAVVCADVILGGRAGVASSISEPGVYFDYPAQPVRTARKNLILKTKLFELLDRIRALEARVKKAEGGDN